MKRRPLVHSQAFFYNCRPFRMIMRHLRPRVCILVYHRIGEALFDPYGQAVSPTNFKRHLQLLRLYYQVGALDTLIEQLPGHSYTDRTVVVTFDDGYADNLTVAYPIAIQLGVPISIFVTVQPIINCTPFWWDELAVALFHLPISSDPLNIDLTGQHSFSITSETNRHIACIQLHSILRHLGTNRREQVIALIRSKIPLDDRHSDIIGRPMTVAELKAFSALPGVTIGAHTMTHPVLGSLSTEDQTHELVASKTLLEKLVNKPITLLSYPFGKLTDVSPITYRLAKHTGYKAAFTTIPCPVVPSTPYYALPRLTVHNWGEEDFMRRLQMFFRESASYQ